MDNIRQGHITAVQVDSVRFPQTIATYKGKETEVVRLSPYGLCSNPPVNSLGLLFKVEGMNGVHYGIFDNVTGRFKNLESGEVQIGNYTTGASIKFSANGDVTIDTDGGNTIINTVNYTLNHSGSATINGDVTVNGVVTATDFDSTGAGVTFNDHTHTESGGGTTSAP